MQVEAPGVAKNVPAKQIEQVNASPEVIVLYPSKHLLQEVWSPSLVFPPVQAVHEVFPGRS